MQCYMKQLLTGLHYCHVNQVLHRDIKGTISKLYSLHCIHLNRCSAHLEWIFRLNWPLARINYCNLRPLKFLGWLVQVQIFLSTTMVFWSLPILGLQGLSPTTKMANHWRIGSSLFGTGKVLMSYSCKWSSETLQVIDILSAESLFLEGA